MILCARSTLRMKRRSRSENVWESFSFRYPLECHICPLSWTDAQTPADTNLYVLSSCSIGTSQDSRGLHSLTCKSPPWSSHPCSYSTLDCRTMPRRPHHNILPTDRDEVEACSTFLFRCVGDIGGCLRICLAENAHQDTWPKHSCWKTITAAWFSRRLLILVLIFFFLISFPSPSSPSMWDYSFVSEVCIC